MYREVAPRVEDWTILVTQLTGLLKLDCDWSDEVRDLPMPVLLVAGDADGLPPRHAIEFCELLDGGKRDAVWDRRWTPCSLPGPAARTARSAAARGVAAYENICSMQNRPSADPRDQAIRAALADASSLAAMLTDEFVATYRGSLRDVYVATLAGFVVDLGGRLEETQGRQYVADFGGRRIGLRFR